MPRLLALALVVLGCGSPRTEPPPADATTKACTTACDCKAGYACHEGACLSGTEAVFCCEACPPQAPAAQGCQRRDGTFASCGAH